MKTFVKTLSPYFVLTFFIFLMGCKKGCIDESALNYDEKAKKDDGSCEYDQTEINPTGPVLKFVFVFDSTQQRLDNVGQVSTIPAGHAAQSPRFKQISAHYIELSPSQFTVPGGGEFIYKGAETSAGGDNAIDFDQAVIGRENQVYTEVPLSDLTPGVYQYARVSVTYQNYDIDYWHHDTLSGSDFIFEGTIASFVGFNTYITDYTINTESLSINANKLQGYWGFESNVLGTSYVLDGQSPSGATTVPNPIASSSPIPAGSCLVTGEFDVPFEITGNETEDIVIELSLSINKSFEWVDSNGNNRYEPSLGENVVDMGLRGLIARKR